METEQSSSSMSYILSDYDYSLDARFVVTYGIHECLNVKIARNNAWNVNFS